MVRHAVDVGWARLTRRDATRKRGGDAGVFLLDELNGALRRFNPWMSGQAVRSVIESLEAVPATIEGNRRMLSWLRGERYRYDERAARSRPVRLVDFDRPDANALHVTWEWRLQPPARKGNRADVMFVVNGIPVAIVEHKNPKDADAIGHGVTQLRRYEQETPELIGAAQLFNVTHLLDYWYGVTWNASRRFMARWKEHPEESYRFAVQSFFEPNEFLRTLRDWVLFYVEDGETRKCVLRQHQRRAVERIVERCSDPEKQRGLIWHTQGSGKTFTLLTAARVILERGDVFRTPTVIVVVDRTELEGQLAGWVDRLLGEMQDQDIPVQRAETKEELQDLFKADRRGLILSMIHKFDQLDKNASVRDNVFVLIDEAHRSVARDLGSCLMAAVPNATIIGFTGTPIAKTQQGKGTFKIFGAEDELGYLDKYTIAESIEDETTVPIRHVMAPSDMTVPSERLDQEFFALAEMEDVTDVEQLNRVLDRAVGLRTFLAADDRIEKVAAFVAHHYREKVEPLGYKAFLVGVSREACAKYKRALDQHLPPQWSEPIYTENAADSVERPLVAELQLSKSRQADARLLFKKASEDPKILVVTDKLLTGYDAPLLYCMYLDKPMRDHVLLQAIARVNRPYVDAQGVRKRIGLVVDFVGVLRELEKALQFDSSDVSGVIEDLDLLLADLLEKIGRAKLKYLDTEVEEGPDAYVEEMVYGRFFEPVSRREFLEDFKEVEALWEILSPSPELRDHIDNYRQLANLYGVVQNAYADGSGYTGDLARRTQSLLQESAVQVGLRYLTKTTTFDAATIEAVRQQYDSDEARVHNLVRGLRKETENTPRMAPVLVPLKQRAERVLQDLEARKTTGLEAMDVLAALVEEKQAATEAQENSALSSSAFGVQWALRNNSDLQAADVAAADVAREADMLLKRFPNAVVNQDERRRLRAALYQPLLGLDAAARSRVVEQVLAILLDATADAGA